jgi:hypothetical protein
MWTFCTPKRCCQSHAIHQDHGPCVGIGVGRGLDIRAGKQRLGFDLGPLCRSAEGCEFLEARSVASYECVIDTCGWVPPAGSPTGCARSMGGSAIVRQSLSALSVSALLAASTIFRWSRWRGLLMDDTPRTVAPPDATCGVPAIGPQTAAQASSGHQITNRLTKAQTTTAFAIRCMSRKCTPTPPAPLVEVSSEKVVSIGGLLNSRPTKLWERGAGRE